MHDLVAEVDGKTLRTAMIDPGGAATLALPALKAGAYNIWCEEPGHRQAGIEADLAVGASGSARAIASGSSSTTLSESTSVHFHGVEVPNEMDGVPIITQPPVKRGVVHL